ncbi:MAG: hypothetical protein NZ899_14815 [Thermoguttaceae bacterium]|nr:hypothetical protein [Thermoguttaceae bacterium]
MLDTLGLVRAVVVDAASDPDQVGAEEVFARLVGSCPGDEVVFGVAAYRREQLVERVRQAFDWLLQTTLRPAGVGRSEVLPKRWIGERTFAQLSHYRPLPG